MGSPKAAILPAEASFFWCLQLDCHQTSPALLQDPVDHDQTATSSAISSPCSCDLPRKTPLQNHRGLTGAKRLQNAEYFNDPCIPTRVFLKCLNKGAKTLIKSRVPKHVLDLPQTFKRGLKNRFILGNHRTLHDRQHHLQHSIGLRFISCD